MNHRHEGVLRWMLANPHRSLADCSRELGFTQAWLSVIIHSDAFQVALAEAQGELSHDTALSIRDKLVGVAHLGLDRLVETIPAAPPEFTLDATERALDRLGYGAPTRGNGGGGVNVNINVSPDELRLARERAKIIRNVEKDEETPAAIPAPAS